ncbi:MAG TPA: excinuclease ABC subunit UvrA [Bacteroidales bacterium]|nr:excinuclease ABC subunit UvrA [Bacteroidales bacterium]
MNSYNHNSQITIKGARVNNLKNIDLAIPLNQFVVITGLSGSGKSSLAFETLFAEGQRRYVESLSSYARQFLNRMPKPEVDFISGIPPAIAIEQKTNTSNPRSTVGTSTELHEYFKLLYARIGKTYAPHSNKEVKKHNVKDVIDYICLQDQNNLGFIAFKPHNQEIKHLIQQGYTRGFIIDEFVKLEQLNTVSDNLIIVVDRFETCHNKEMLDRIADSIETSFFEGQGTCIIGIQKNGQWQLETFSNKFEADGILFEEPHPQMFNFNSPAGACPTCEGFGQTIGIDEDLVIPNKNLSVYSDAVACWKGETMQEWKMLFISNAHKAKFPVHTPYSELSEEEKKMLWEGTPHFPGINDFFKFLQENLYKIQYRVMLSRYRGKTICPTCKGKRLKPETEYIKINGKSLGDILMLPITDVKMFVNSLKLSKHEKEIASRILLEINVRLDYLIKVGLGYLTLNRSSSTLSGGESQRIHLSTSLGSSLVGSLYILDEPSIGLHPSDNEKLIHVLITLRDIGNTVLVVEHDEDIIRSADYIIDMGPGAGFQGGKVVFAGTPEQLNKSTEGYTSKYLAHSLSIPTPEHRRKWNLFLEIKNAYLHNLKHIDVKIPLKVLTVVTGVSGSGKSTLINQILFPALQKKLGNSLKTSGYSDLLGNIEYIQEVILVDQNPIGRSTRSNALTYLKIYDDIRALYSSQPLAKQMRFTPSHFSFNINGGRCEECLGDGYITVEMQFMADVKLECESCHGKRFKSEILEVEYRGKNIFDVLELTVDEAISFFKETNGKTESEIVKKLGFLQQVGLGYLKLGQSTSTLSGGESQRLKLAGFISQKNSPSTLFIFDEPTTGLHIHDIQLLLKAFQLLIERHHSIILIEHHLDVIKSADWVIDLGPEGGEKGGYVVATGTPEDIAKNENSITGKYLSKKLAML